MNLYERRDLARLQEALFEQIDVSNRDGLEIGPLDRPLVSRLEGVCSLRRLFRRRSLESEVRGKSQP